MTMYSFLQLSARYAKYYLTASNSKGHGMHSPFVFSFITQVLNDDRFFYAYRNIENLRQSMLIDRRNIQMQDMNADTGLQKQDTGKVAAIARASMMPQKFGPLLFRIVDHYAPARILELGTSLGIATAYLAAANEQSQVVSMENTPGHAAVAKENFTKLGLRNIHMVEGDFEKNLAVAVSQLGRVDLVVVNGTYGYASTLRYFRELLPALHESSIILFKDIHRSAEMEQAWKEIQQDTAVTLSIDLFFAGLVFFRKEQKVKQHFAIRF